MKQRVRRRIDFKKRIFCDFWQVILLKNEGENVVESWYLVCQFGQSYGPNIYKDTEP